MSELGYAIQFLAAAVAVVASNIRRIVTALRADPREDHRARATRVTRMASSSRDRWALARSSA
ncbi:hypothetical protein ASD19_12190 [Microbacterium sp. Root53]|nr:hypothetical protein ASD19_12190 [Microbacterium sp. Root53]